MPDGQRLVALFDIDLTLIRNPIDREVITAALDEATGTPGLLADIDFMGRSDRWLVDEVSGRHGLEAGALFEAYGAAYRRLLREMLLPLPRPGTTLGVATGNLRDNAVTKLTHGRVIEFFDPLLGGFGDDHADRADIVRAASIACACKPRDHLVVIGDTVHDVRAALAVGAIPFAVATGHATAEELAAAGAHIVLPGLGDAAAALAAITGN
jgi:phosphoglycolate phosphatase